MNKLILAIFLSICSVQFAQAQLFKLGARGGIHSSSIDFNDLNVFNKETRDSIGIKAGQANVGFRVGLVGRITLSAFYIQPEIIFRSSRNTYEITEFGAAIEEKRDETFFNIDVPVLAGVKLGPLRAQVGPVASLILNKNSDFTDKDSYERDFTSAEWALQYGLGLDLGKIAIDVNRQGPLTNANDKINIGGTEFNLAPEEKYTVIMLSLFF